MEQINKNNHLNSLLNIIPKGTLTPKSGNVTQQLSVRITYGTL